MSLEQEWYVALHPVHARAGSLGFTRCGRNPVKGREQWQNVILPQNTALLHCPSPEGLGWTVCKLW